MTASLKGKNAVIMHNEITRLSHFRNHSRNVAIAKIALVVVRFDGGSLWARQKFQK